MGDTLQGILDRVTHSCLTFFFHLGTSLGANLTVSLDVGLVYSFRRRSKRRSCYGLTLERC